MGTAAGENAAVSGAEAGSRPQALRAAAWPLAAVRRALAGRPFLSSVSVMLTGAAAGQLLSLLAAPLLTRLYTPQQFGILSVYSAILAILVVVASLRYELAVPLATSEEDAVNLAAVCGCALVATTALISLGVLAFREQWIEGLWPTPVFITRVDLYRSLLILGFLLLGAYFIALYLATWQGAFRDIARTRVAQGVVGPATQVGLGLAGAGAPGLVIGSLLGQSTGTLGLLYRALTRRRGLLRAVSWRRAARLAWQHRRFPLIASWAALIDAAGGSQLLYLLVSTQYSAGIAGFIFLTERIVARPLSLIGTSILQVYVGEAGKIRSTDPAKLRRRFYQVTSRQLALAAAWIVLTNMAGTFLFPIVFGENWGEAVVYLRAVSLAYLAQAVVLPVFHTLQLLDRQGVAAGWQIGRLILIVAVFGTSLALDLSAATTIFFYSIAQAVCCAVLFALMARSIEGLQGGAT